MTGESGLAGSALSILPSDQGSIPEKGPPNHRAQKASSDLAQDADAPGFEATERGKGLGIGIGPVPSTSSGHRGTTWSRGLRRARVCKGIRPWPAGSTISRPRRSRGRRRMASWAWRTRCVRNLSKCASSTSGSLRTYSRPTARRDRSCARGRSWRPRWARSRPDGHDPGGIAGGRGAVSMVTLCRWFGWRGAACTTGRPRQAPADPCCQLRGLKDLRHQGPVRDYRLGDTGGAGPNHQKSVAKCVNRRKRHRSRTCVHPSERPAQGKMSKYRLIINNRHIAECVLPKKNSGQVDPLDHRAQGSSAIQDQSAPQPRPRGNVQCPPRIQEK